jgi:hypothetical protein
MIFIIAVEDEPVGLQTQQYRNSRLAHVLPREG